MGAAMLDGFVWIRKLYCVFSDSLWSFQKSFVMNPPPPPPPPVLLVAVPLQLVSAARWFWG